MRQWDHKADSLFLGLVLNRLPDEPVPEGYALREFPGKRLLRLSGSQRLDEQKPLDSLKAYAQKYDLELELSKPMRLSGQPFLFTLGIGLIIFLSGACKFVFMHQMTNEADDIHLQNY